MKFRPTTRGVRAACARALRASASTSVLLFAVACGGGGAPTDEPAAGAPEAAAPEGIEPIEQVAAATPVESDVPLVDLVEASVEADEVEGRMQAAAAAPADFESCRRVPVPARGGAVRSVRDFGATPNDGSDDTAAIQRAINSMQPGETLAFGPGRYLTDRSLHVRRKGITLDGRGTTLHANNPDSMALQVHADDVTVSGFTLTAHTAGRRSTAYHARIAVIAEITAIGRGYHRVRNATIVDNRIVESGAPGSAGANSASSVGILVQNADGFVVARNLVARTLADGIHITGASRRGRVLDNVLRENGDDAIAVVSYADWGDAAKNSAGRMLGNWNARVEQRLARDILIAGNDVSGPYWGRGIAVVGGRGVTIAHNTLTNIPRAAAILLGREAGYQTFGTHEVWVQQNVLRDVQTGMPSYSVGSGFSPSRRTGHGGVEVHTAMFDDEARDAKLRGELGVGQVLVRGNRVERSASPGVRAGVRFAGGVGGRGVQTGWVGALTVENNDFAAVAREPIQLLTTERTSAYCAANSRDGRAYGSGACRGNIETIRGANLRCGGDGRLL